MKKLEAGGVPVGGWVAGYIFHPTRKWRLDLAWPDIKLGVEIQGGTWARGKHSRGRGQAEDCQKISEAVALGWSIMTVTTEQVMDLKAHPWIVAAIQVRTGVD